MYLHLVTHEKHNQESLINYQGQELSSWGLTESCVMCSFMQIMKVQMRVPLGLWTCSRLIKTYLEAAGEQTFYKTVTVAEE